MERVLLEREGLLARGVGSLIRTKEAGGRPG
jgi:hypothetical protein